MPVTGRFGHQAVGGRVQAFILPAQDRSHLTSIGPVSGKKLDSESRPRKPVTMSVGIWWGREPWNAVGFCSQECE